MEFRTYFVYFHTFSYKFKVQRTPTEFGLPVFLQEIHKLCAKTLLNLEELLRMQKVARNEKSCSKYEDLPSKLVESPISRNWKLRTEATTGRVWARLLRGAFVLLLGSRSNARCSYECWEVFRWRLAFDHGACHLCALIVKRFPCFGLYES